MSVRRMKRRDPDTGAMRESGWWMWCSSTRMAARSGSGRCRPCRLGEEPSSTSGNLRAALLSGEYGRKETQSVTLAEFTQEFFDTYVKANNKPSEIENKNQFIKVSSCRISVPRSSMRSARLTSRGSRPTSSRRSTRPRASTTTSRRSEPCSASPRGGVGSSAFPVSGGCACRRPRPSSCPQTRRRRCSRLRRASRSGRLPSR